ncbi:FKBP-type peptidyl-prolyl cis-trans isomerase [Wenyingzhuangia sp. IMCC45467]
MNFKKLCLAVATVVFAVGCDENNSIEQFDHAGQYVIEKPLVDEFLATHYYDDVDNEIKEIDNNQSSLSEDANLQTLTTTYNEVEFTMYSYVYEQGENEEAGNQDDGVLKGSPDADDLVNVAYKVSGIDGDVHQESDLNDGFLYLDSLIEGWRVGMSVFRGGFASEPEDTEPRQYTGTGKGFMIIPSGLAYQNFGSGAISPNETLVFKIELRTVTSYGEDL